MPPPLFWFVPSLSASDLLCGFQFPALTPYSILELILWSSFSSQHFLPSTFRTSAECPWSSSTRSSCVQTSLSVQQKSFQGLSHPLDLIPFWFIFHVPFILSSPLSFLSILVIQTHTDVQHKHATDKKRRQKSEEKGEHHQHQYKRKDEEKISPSLCGLFSSLKYKQDQLFVCKMYLFVWLFRPKSKQFPEILALGDDAFRYSLKQHVKTQYEDDSNLTWFVLVSSSRTLNYWTSWLAMIPMKNVPRREGCLQWNAFFYYWNVLLNECSFYQVCQENPF